MKKTFILLLVLLYSCNKADKPIESSNIEFDKIEMVYDYYYAYKNFDNTPIDKMVFPVILCNILSEKLLEKEMNWYENIYSSMTQLMD